jgi:hypothetical protein
MAMNALGFTLRHQSEEAWKRQLIHKRATVRARFLISARNAMLSVRLISLASSTYRP